MKKFVLHYEYEAKQHRILVLDYSPAKKEEI
jgi:hypothetical protein